MKKFLSGIKIPILCIAILISISWLNTYYYGLYTPMQIKKYGICIKRASFGHSSDFYQYMSVKCENGEILQYLSDAIELDGLEYIFPPMRLIYESKDNTLYISIKTSSGIKFKWMFDETKHEFVKISRGPGPS